MISGDPTIEDVEYRRAGDLTLLARLYRPSGAGPFPAVVSVHGGRWVSQTRLSNEVIDVTLAKAGILVMAIDFRMPPEAQYPEPVADINYAIRWLKHHAAELGSAPHLVGGVGTSSGGHQLMLAAMKPNDPRYASLERQLTDQTADLGFAVACWPVLDPLARYRMALRKNMKLHVDSHDAYWPGEPSMEEGNPQAILDRNETVEMPPLLLIQGTGDDVVPPDMTERFAETYERRGGSVALKTYADQPHTFITKDAENPASHAAVADIADFILRQAAVLRR